MLRVQDLGDCSPQTVLLAYIELTCSSATAVPINSCLCRGWAFYSHMWSYVQFELNILLLILSYIIVFVLMYGVCIQAALLICNSHTIKLTLYSAVAHNWSSLRSFWVLLLVLSFCFPSTLLCAHKMNKVEWDCPRTKSHITQGCLKDLLVDTHWEKLSFSWFICCVIYMSPS